MDRYVWIAMWRSLCRDRYVTVRITDSGSSATLSPWRSGESCLSKEQRETPLTRTTEVK